MCHQQYFVIPLFPNNGKGSIEVCKILFQAFAEERILVRQYRASVLAEVHSIKVITVGIHDIQKYGQKLGNYVTRDTIQNGIHDLILSEKDSRDHVYRTVFDWLPGK